MPTDNNFSDPIPVRVVEIPPRGASGILQTRFGQVRFDRTNLAGSLLLLVLRENPRRVRALIKNRGTDSIILGHDSNVQPHTGYRLEANDSPIEIRGPGAVWGVMDPAQAATAQIITVDEYIVDLASRKDGKKK